MGSRIMEPDDLNAFVTSGSGEILNNLTTICSSANKIHLAGVFYGENPLEFSVPLLFLQLGVCAAIIIFFSQLFKPLGQPLIVSQILGGLVLGSSGLSHWDKFRETFFPLRGFIFLDVISALGRIFYFFLIGVQTDISLIKKIDKRAFGIGCGSVFISLVLITIYPKALFNSVSEEIAKSLLGVGRIETFVNFTMIASLLSELRLLNSELGKIALSSAMAANFFSFCFFVVKVSVAAPSEGKYSVLSKMYVSIVFMLIIFAVRPVVLSILKRNSDGQQQQEQQPLKEGTVVTMLLAVLVVAFFGQTFGLHIYFAPLLLGITIPPEHPLGSALVERLDIITSWIFMPIFFVKIGMVVNIFTLNVASFLSISIAIFVSALGKFLGAFLLARHYKLLTRDAILLGFILNSQGALELGMFKILKKDKVIDDESFVVMCIWIMLLMATITPVIRYLFDPSRRYVVHKRRTVMHSRPKFDLSVLVCIHEEEDVPNSINLLEALNPTRRSHLVVYMLHLVELLGRANPQLIQHKFANVKTSSRSRPSEYIVNAFRYFAQNNQEIVAMYPFTAISPSATMHDDVCSLALEKKTSLILVPFHQKFHSNGVVSLSKYKMKIVNHHVLDKAPCSVALIVERGILKVSKPIASRLCPLHLAVVFIGGPDDREAMFIGARMAGHPNINMTMIRLLENRNVPSSDIEERIVDNESVVEFRQIMADNHRVRYIEEVANDGTETVSVLRSLGSNFDLVMVGRQHSPSSALVQGIIFWNEHTELGAIGEVLATSDFMGNSMIMVVQQHTKGFSEDQENHQESVIRMERFSAEDDSNH